jgi:hypothetical protein
MSVIYLSFAVLFRYNEIGLNLSHYFSDNTFTNFVKTLTKVLIIAMIT